MFEKQDIRKAIIPAAGLGTRFLPVTKSMPKEMLPIINIPAIHFVVEEAIQSGIEDIIIITARGKRSIEDYFDDSPELESFLEQNQKDHLLKLVQNISTLADIHYIRQKEPRGLGDAVLMAEKHIGDEPFAVLLGDDIVKSDIPCIRQLMDIYKKHHNSVIAVEPVPSEMVSSYGIIQGSYIDNNLMKIENVVEKPKISEAPSNIGAIGRYIFTPALFECIRKSPVRINKEIQIADGINILTHSQPVLAYRFSGKRYDIGDKYGYVQATLDFAMNDAAIRKKLLPYLKSITAKTQN
nr:UTP--glucose-1-phosphate uridylyltransferase GalU [uncultured Methanoregula sp.]